MKKNDCLCRRYTAKEWGNDETTIEVFIGYKLLGAQLLGAVPSHDGRATPNRH